MRGWDWAMCNVLILAPPLACASHDDGPERVASAVLYGGDDRRQWYEVSDAVLRDFVAQSLVAIVPETAIAHSSSDNLTFAAPTLSERFGLCEGERYAEEQSVASCTGTLIGADLVLTAGHCFVDEADCRKHRFVFGFHYLKPQHLRPLTRDDVRTCERLIVHQRGASSTDRYDYAVVELDSAAGGAFRPATLDSTRQSITTDALLTATGFMGGLPAKVDASARVVEPNAGSADIFTARFDTIQGSSGMPLLNASSQVVGIHVRGLPDFSPEDDCARSLHIEESRQHLTEDVAHLDPVLAQLCAHGPYLEACGGTALIPGSPNCAFGPVSRPPPRVAFAILLLMTTLAGWRWRTRRGSAAWLERRTSPTRAHQRL